jgi:uncharacterized membrane protein
LRFPARELRNKRRVKISYLWRGTPGHPTHPPLTDATIGAYTFAFVASILSKAGVADQAAAKAWWLALVVALCSSLLTVATGLVDWLTISRGTPLFRTATTHMLVMVTASVFFLLAAIFGHRCYVAGDISTGPFVLTILGFVALTVGGWIGGTITYVHGMRVLSLADEPAAEASSPRPTPAEEQAEH